MPGYAKFLDIDFMHSQEGYKHFTTPFQHFPAMFDFELVYTWMYTLVYICTFIYPRHAVLTYNIHDVFIWKIYVLFGLWRACMRPSLWAKHCFWLFSVSVASQETASAIAMLEEQRTRAPSEVDELGMVRIDGRVWGHL